MGASSDGRVVLPSIPIKDTKGTTPCYNLIVNLNDKIFEIDRNRHDANPQKTLFALHDWAEENSNPEDLKLKCRIKSSSYLIEIFEGDFTLTSEELTAFLKTIELSKIFAETAK